MGDSFARCVPRILPLPGQRPHQTMPADPYTSLAPHDRTHFPDTTTHEPAAVADDGASFRPRDDRRPATNWRPGWCRYPGPLSDLRNPRTSSTFHRACVRRSNHQNEFTHRRPRCQAHAPPKSSAGAGPSTGRRPLRAVHARKLQRRQASREPADVRDVQRRRKVTQSTPTRRPFEAELRPTTSTRRRCEPLLNAKDPSAVGPPQVTSGA